MNRCVSTLGAESSLQILDEKIYVEVLHKRNVRQRIARAAHCGVETVGRNLVLYGDLVDYGPSTYPTPKKYFPQKQGFNKALLRETND